MPIVLHWFRRDLRLTDNTALYYAAASLAHVVPAYVLSDWKTHHGWTGPKRQQFLCGCLESLSKNLESIGSKLIIRAGDAIEELEKLAEETGAEAIYFNRSPDPFGQKTEEKLAALCKRLGIECHGFKDTVMHGPDEVLTGSDQPYRVFTPYSKNWLALPKAPPLPRVANLGAASEVPSLETPTLA
ncbi:MAG: phrB-2, partial [Verrucomicrobiaceae bacterium]|nr:phrB-2 [Verrucomicrobiaceae bacterium]